jgi:hypothetical protein
VVPHAPQLSDYLMSAYERTTDSSHPTRHVPKVPTCDIEYVDCQNKKPPEDGSQFKSDDRRSGRPSMLALTYDGAWASVKVIVHADTDDRAVEMRARLCKRGGPRRVDEGGIVDDLSERNRRCDRAKVIIEVLDLGAPL